ncbi:MAG: hypothetical protein ACD_4C00354G0003 [uncultured bacterium (gcode 4)]|uniref:NTP pyrophosphohydrolase MazG-like domain-containing protein n=1 Tax=uncultured bacterium (gcode 4) TaxID=1234023 RepID=K2FWJ5_9BACT|nr:MAG: hypothetical protein ACD_4C00354G0003 [uncultured bacterium (gcode 4)]
MSALNKLLEILELNRKLDPFYEETESKKVFDLLLGEIEEWRQEYEKWDNVELEKEMWDVFWNLFLLMNKLEDEGKITKENVYEKIHNKMLARKSFLLEWRKVDKEEAMKIWNDAKRSEWYEESRLWKN